MDDGLIEDDAEFLRTLAATWVRPNTYHVFGGTSEECADRIFRIASRLSDHKVLREALEDAREAIASLATDDLGQVIVSPEADGETGYEYPVRDELLAKIDAVLTTVPLGEGEGE